VFAGLASRMITGVGGSDAIAEALEAEDRPAKIDPAAMAFRILLSRRKAI
jgi:hypothetical protein